MHDTFNRVFAALKPEAFLEMFMAWTQTLRATISGEIVALDGKALRRALGRGDSVRVIVSAWAASNSLVLGQIEVPDKTNEITAVPKLLRALELSGCIVTLDAMGCQKEIAQEIKEADADYVLALKGNQGQCYEEIKAYLDDAVARHHEKAPARKNAVPLAYKETVEKDHGRIETRRYWQSGELDWFAGRAEWEGLRSVGMVESVRQAGEASPTTCVSTTSQMAPSPPRTSAHRGSAARSMQARRVAEARSAVAQHRTDERSVLRSSPQHSERMAVASCTSMLSVLRSSQGRETKA